MKIVENHEDMSTVGAPRQKSPYKNKHLEHYKTRRTTKRGSHLEQKYFFLGL